MSAYLHLVSPSRAARPSFDRATAPETAPQPLGLGRILSDAAKSIGAYIAVSIGAMGLYVWAVIVCGAVVAIMNAPMIAAGYLVCRAFNSCGFN